MATISKFQYKAPVLTDTEFRINREYVRQKGAIPINIHLQREVTPLENENKAIFELTVYLNGNETKWNDDAPYWAKVKYGAQFEWDDNVTEEDIERFLLYKFQPLSFKPGLTILFSTHYRRAFLSALLIFNLTSHPYLFQPFFSSF